MTSVSSSIERIRRSYRELGPVRFVLFNLFMLGWLGLFFYLAVTADWTRGCGIDGIVRTYACTFDLAAAGTPEGVALAVWLVATPAFLVFYIAGRAREFRKERGR